MKLNFDHLDSVFDFTITSLDVTFDEDFLTVKLVDFTPLVDEDFLQSKGKF